MGRRRTVAAEAKETARGDEAEKLWERVNVQKAEAEREAAKQDRWG